MDRKNRIIRICVLLAVMLISLSGCGAKEGKAKYIFLFIGDGMGAGHVAVAESYLSYQEESLGGEQLSFTGFPILGMCTTHSANKQVTCSSASGTAIACGTKTNNSMLGVDPEGNKLKSMAYTLKEDGYRIGIMSSVPINHATPAAFYGHNEKRSDYYNISKEIPATGFEFFGGAGFIDYFGKDGKQEATPEYLDKNGYDVYFGEEEFRSNMKDKDRIIFCQPSSKASEAGNYVVEGVKEEDSNLKDILKMCLDYIGDSEPFFIMCEGGEIDWAAHANNTKAMIESIYRFDDAVKVAIEFYKEHPEETLILVTADHETGGITLGANGSSSIKWAELDDAEDNGDNKEINDAIHIGWTSSGHTGAPVPIYAIGKGAERFSGRMDNTDISKKILLKE